MAKPLRLLEIAAWAALVPLILFSGVGLWRQLELQVRAGTLQGDFGCYYVSAQLMERDPASTYDGPACRTLGEEMGFPGTALFCPCLRYPPLFIWLLLPLARLPYGQAVAWWTVLNALLFALVVAAGTALLRRMGGRRFLLPLALLLPPFVYTLLIGQVNVLLLIFLLPLLLARSHKSVGGQVLAGLGLALAAHLKATWALLGLFLLLRKRFWAAGAAILFTLVLWGIDLALLGPAFIPGYLASLGAGDQVNRLLISGMDGSLWGAAVAVFGPYSMAAPAGWVPPEGYMPLQPLLWASPPLALVLPALGSLWLLGRSLWLAREGAGDTWDHAGLLAVTLGMAVVPHSGNHAVMLLFPAFLYLLARWRALAGWERWLLWGSAAALLLTPFWINLNALSRPLAWTALPLLAGRVFLWVLVARSSCPSCSRRRGPRASFDPTAV